MVVASRSAHVDAAAMCTDNLPVRPTANAPWAMANAASSARPRPALAAQRTAWLLAGLTLLFAFRVAGQAIQRWMPQAVLPPFAAFQGSAIPYAVLLGIQLLLLVLMTSVAVRVGTRGVATHPTLAASLKIAGAIYFGAMLLRLVIGICAPNAPAWFSATIPAFFHLVLATYILVFAGYLRPPIGCVSLEDTR